MTSEPESAAAERRTRLGRVRPPVVAISGLLLLLGLVAAGCGEEDRTVAAADRDGAPAPMPEAQGRDSGIVAVQLEPVPGVFIEGFEIGLRLETGKGELIVATLWSDFVQSTGATDIEAFYDSVFTQSVPAGTVRLRAEVNIGIGPGPEVPDLTGDLPCELVVEVEPGTETVVEVSFGGSNDCLRLLAETGSGSGAADDGSGTTGPTPTTSTTVPGPVTLDVGTTHYVDVDLECQAFELGGIWVLVGGDTSTWQPPGERHEGGMFTIESPGRGRFVGDASGVKTATFERTHDDGDPPCVPLPRPTS